MSLNLSNGNVGIGTTGPQELLHVGAGGDASFTSEIDLIVTRAGPSGMSTRNSTADVETFMFAEAAQGIVGTATNHPFQLRTNNAAVMTLTTSGNVGIGTTSPTFKLDVAGSGYFSSSLFAGGAITGTSTLNITGLATFVSASTTNVGSTGSAYFATSNGNVGIGTTEPDVELRIGNSVDTDDKVVRIATDSTTGDPYLSLLINGIDDWTVGVDNSDSNKFKIGIDGPSAS